MENSAVARLIIDNTASSSVFIDFSDIYLSVLYYLMPAVQKHPAAVKMPAILKGNIAPLLPTIYGFVAYG